MPASARICRAWYSWIFMVGRGYTLPRSRTNGSNRAVECLDADARDGVEVPVREHPPAVTDLARARAVRHRRGDPVRAVVEAHQRAAHRRVGRRARRHRAARRADVQLEPRAVHDGGLLPQARRPMGWFYY